MSLSSYADIQGSVAAYMNRTDLTARIPDFIRMAEARLNRLIDDNVNLTIRTQITPDANGNTTLPDDFNGMVSLRYPGNAGGRLTYVTPSAFDDMPSGAGIPTKFTLSAGQLSVWPVSQTALNITYVVKLDALTLGPNWLLDNHPDAYVFGALVQASLHMVEDERVPVWKSQFEQTIAEINAQGRDIAFGGPLQVKSSGGE